MPSVLPHNQESGSHHSQVSINLGGLAPNSCDELRKEMVNRENEKFAHRERQYMQMKSTLTDFKDGSLSALGKIGYQLTDIA